MSHSKMKVIYDEEKEEFEDWCHLYGFPTGVDRFGKYTHPTVREYWVVWQAAYHRGKGATYEGGV